MCSCDMNMKTIELSSSNNAAPSTNFLFDSNQLLKCSQVRNRLIIRGLSNSTVLLVRPLIDVIDITEVRLGSLVGLHRGFRGLRKSVSYASKRLKGTRDYKGHELSC